MKNASGSFNRKLGTIPRNMDKKSSVENKVNLTGQLVETFMKNNSRSWYNQQSQILS